MAGLSTALRQPGVALVLVAWVLSRTGSWAFALLLALWAHDLGGATAVGVVILARTVPSALLGTVASVLVDRYPRRLVLLSSCALRLLLHGVVGLGIWLAAPAAAVLVAAATASVVGTVTRPAHLALLPELVRTPAELAAANTATSTGDYVGFLVGSVGTGLLAAGLGLPAAAVGDVAAVGLACLVLLLLAVRGRTAASGAAPRPHLDTATVRAGMVAGLRTVALDRDLRLLTGVHLLVLAVRSALDVLLVVAALELLGTGRAGAGALGGAWGVGGLAGGVVALGLVRTTRLTGVLLAGLLLVGAPLVALGAQPDPVAALLLLVVVGLGFAWVESTLLTLIQRLVAPDLLGRVFGVVEVVGLVGASLGAAVAPLLSTAFGPALALVVTGATLPVVALVAGSWLAHLGADTAAPDDVYVALRGLRVLAGLSVAAVETLAVHARVVPSPPGTVVLREGDLGDTLHVLVAGEVDVHTARDGHLATLGPGDHVGEIALLRRVPRTATVTTTRATTCVVLDSETFLGALATDGRGLRLLDAVAAERMAQQTT